MRLVTLRHALSTQHCNGGLGETPKERDALIAIGRKALTNDRFFETEGTEDLHAARIDNMSTGMRGRRRVLLIDDGRYPLLRKQEGARQPNRARADNRNFGHHFLRAAPLRRRNLIDRQSIAHLTGSQPYFLTLQRCVLCPEKMGLSHDQRKETK